MILDYVEEVENSNHSAVTNFTAPAGTGFDGSNSQYGTYSMSRDASGNLLVMQRNPIYSGNSAAGGLWSCGVPPTIGAAAKTATKLTDAYMSEGFDLASGVVFAAEEDPGDASKTRILKLESC